MGSNLVIVALPADDDPVWKVSSEKKPHLTICFLGDANSNPHVDRIMLFVEHAVQIAARGPFYLEVDHREVLGPDKADVLMFRKDWSFRWLNRFRNQLLQNNDIKAGYESVEQYPEYQPHLTLGYPETPAHEDKMPEYGINMVRFDRIAVWTGDYEGPDWRLEWPEQQMLDEVAWGVDLGLERQAAGMYTLQHHGVKGMKWGVRRENFHRSEAQKFNKAADKTEGKGFGPLKGKASKDYRKAAQRHEAKANEIAAKRTAKMDKKAAKLDAQWTKNQFTLAKGVERHNAMAEHFNQRIGAHNDKFSKDDFSKEAFDHPDKWSPRYKEYMNGVAKIEEASFRHAVEQVHGTSPSGKLKAGVELDSDGQTLRMTIKPTDVKHAATDLSSEEVFLFKVTMDSNGLITSVEAINDSEDSMAQTIDLGEEFLDHHGIKGMKWGVRKEDVASGAKTVGRAVAKGAKAVDRGVDNFNFEINKDTEWVRNDILRGATDKLHADLPAIKAKHPTGSKRINRLKKPFSPEAKAYREDVKTAYLKHLESTANEMTNAQGTRRYTLKENGEPNTSQYFWEVGIEKIQHTASATIKVRPIFDEDGYIVDLEIMPDEMAQSALYGETFISGLLDNAALTHYGIKGMRWGFRKSTPAAVTPSATSRVHAGIKGKTKVQVQGGENHPAHEDAIKVAEARAKLRKSGPAALSNNELRDVANRLQLENQVALLTSSKGKRFVSQTLQNESRNLAREGVKKGAKAGGKHVVKRAARTAATAGATAALL